MRLTSTGGSDRARGLAGGAREGLAAVTIRSIAKEIGYTTGIVMHHFPTKDAIIEEMIERLYRGLRDIYLTEMNGGPDAHRLERLLVSALPLQPRLAFFGWKLSVVLQGEVPRPRQDRGRPPALLSLGVDIRAELGLLQENGLLPPATDLDMAATRLMVPVEGIGANFVLRPKAMPPALQRRSAQEEPRHGRFVVQRRNQPPEIEKPGRGPAFRAVP